VLSLLRCLVFAAGFLGSLSSLALPAHAQGMQVLRDTETEEMLRNYEIPLARAAGLDVNNVHVYLMGDMSVNAFATQPADIYIFAGILLWLHSPNELIGVMAHETGHISAGHLTRTSFAMQKAAIPMMLSLVAGLAAMIAGAGELGMAMMQMGQSVAMAQFAAFSRVQESTADQIAAKLLLATHQSPLGMYDTFQRFAQEEAMSAYKIDKYAVDHPTGQDRVMALQDLVQSSPYREVKDSPQSVHTFDMVQAKLAGYVLPVDEVLRRYPLTDTSEPARYARAMAYMRKPDFKQALAEINSLIKQEPDNPYFYEVRGQIYVSMAKPREGIPDYQKAVDLRPTAPLLRQELASALLATDDPSLAGDALKNLKAALLAENDDLFTWYETAQAYSTLNNKPMADLSTAELNYHGGNMKRALIFAMRARAGLPQGTPDWQRASDIISTAGPQARQ
jgi:predicted Zn-dependent protease